MMLHYNLQVYESTPLDAPAGWSARPADECPPPAELRNGLAVIVTVRAALLVAGVQVRQPHQGVSVRARGVVGLSASSSAAAGPARRSAVAARDSPSREVFEDGCPP